MGVHDAPSSWLDRWRDAEPVRLYLYAATSAVVAAALVAGWLTAELAVAVTGVAAAVLMLPAISAARHETYPPRTVDRLLDEQHRLSYRQGVDAAEQALDRARRRLLQQHPLVPPLADAVVAAETRELAAVTGQAEREWPRDPRRPCPYMAEDGRRCILPWHPATFGHRLEDGKGQE